MLKNDEITISGVTWKIPALLRYIAETMEYRGEPIPLPEPTRFSILWKTAGNGAWHGVLEAHWEFSNNAYNRHVIYGTTILRITVDPSTGNFGSQCVLNPKRLLVVSPMFDECKVSTEGLVLKTKLVEELHALCIKDEYNNDRIPWWE
jgi:hypothetical protein